MFLEQLFTEHKRWVTMSYSICQNMDVAEDYVQEMYLKMNGREVPPNVPGYVYMTLRSLFISEMRRNREFVSGNLDYHTPSEYFEGDRVFKNDFDYNLAADIEVDYEVLLPEAMEVAVVKSLFEALTSHEKKLLRYSYEFGQREFCRRSTIAVNTITVLKRKFKKSVWQKLTNLTSQEVETLLSATLTEIQTSARVAENVKIF